MVSEIVEKGFVLGASGLVGHRVHSALTCAGVPVVGYRNRSIPESILETLDITDFDSVEKKMKIERPSHVFHCANRPGGVDACETNPEAARIFHLNATRNLARLCREIGAVLIFISTDCVFGDHEEAVAESDVAEPMNIYGKLKLAAEETISAELKQSIVIRTTNVYGWDPNTNTPNYSMQVLWDLQRKGQHFASEAMATPTYVDDIVGAIFHLLQRGLFGIYHCVGPSVVSRFKWAQLVGQAFGYDKSAITLAERIQGKSTVKRPKVHLSTRKILNTGFSGFKGPEEGVNEMSSKLKRSKIQDFTLEPT